MGTCASECFHSFFWVSQTCFYTCNLIETRRTCFLFFLENTATLKRKSICLLWSSKTLILFAQAIITSTAGASSVFLLSYRNTVLNQSAHVFAFGYFLQHFDNVPTRATNLVVAQALISRYRSKTDWLIRATFRYFRIPTPSRWESLCLLES